MAHFIFRFSESIDLFFSVKENFVVNNTSILNISIIYLFGRYLNFKIEIVLDIIELNSKIQISNIYHFTFSSRFYELNPLIFDLIILIIGNAKPERE